MALPFRFAAGLLVGVGLAAPPAHAVITRDDVPDAEYLVPDADQPALVDLFWPGDCLGTLIAPSFLLTVAHCAQDLDPDATLVVAGTDHDVAEVILHPDWKAFPNDVAVVRFAAPVDGVDPIPLYRETDEVDRTLTLYGRGLHGTGLDGEHGATDDGKLRRVTNVVTRATEQWLEVRFEAPDDPAVTALEGVGAGGDSGGPEFLDTADGRFLAGLNSWGDAQPYADLGKYGAWDYSTRVSTFADWIDSVAGTAPPRPEAPSDRGPSRGSTGGCGCQGAPGLAGPWVWVAAFGLARVRRRVRGVRGP